MKTLRKIGSAIVILAMLVGFLPVGVQSASAATGGFNVSGGNEGTDYSYSDGVLTINSSRPLTISTSSQTSDRIAIDSNVNANLTLNGVNIQAPANTSAIDVPNGASLMLTLANGSQNTLAVTSSSTTYNSAGIHVPDNASLTIQCAAAATDSSHQCTENGSCGKLSVTGGAATNNGCGGAGIGGNGTNQSQGETSGSVSIIGGDITVIGGSCPFPGPGIGGGTSVGNGGGCGAVYITGGIVAVTGGSCTNTGNGRGAAGIGGGNSSSPFNSAGSGGTVVITGGTVSVTGGTGIGNSGYGGTGIGGGASPGTGGAGGTVIILTDVTVTSGKGNDSGGGTTGNTIGGGLGSSGSKGNDGDGIRPSTGGNNNTYEVYGELTFPEGVTIPEGITINIPDGASLSLPEGASWPDNVTITGSGSIDPKLTATITISANLDKTHDGNAVSLDSSGYTYTGDTTTPTITITWHEDSSGTIGDQLTDNAAPSAPGTYWVKVSAAETNRYAEAEATKQFTISQPLAAPTGLAWSATTPGQATWSAVTNASGYSVQLYKDGSAQGDPVTASGTSHDFQITEAGSYTFTVTATGSGAYSDSSPSSQSAALYTVSFDTMGGTGTIPMQLVPNGGTVTAPAEPTRTGHRFDGWYSDSGLNTEWDFESDTVTAATTLYAKWTAIDYAITITVQSGTGNSATASVNSTTATSANMGDTVTLTATPAEGYHFVEWQVTSGGVTISDNSFTMPAGAVAITAVFEEHTFTGWTANGNDTHTGTCSCGETSTQACTYENGVCTVCGYVDITTTDPANSTVKEGETATFTVTATGDNISYQWQSSINGGAWVDIDRVTGSSYTTQAATMDMDGYQYRCVVSNTTGDSATSSAATLTVNKTPSTIEPAFIGYFVEHYQQDPVSGAYELYEREYFVDEINAEVTATPKTYTGYAYNSAAAGTVTSGTLNEINSEADIVTLKLYYDPESYSVTLETNGGTIDSGNVTEYTYGIGAALPTAEDMTHDGYVFQGWYESSDFSGEAVTAISATDTGDKTYYAKWTKLYTVTVTAESGGTVSGGGTFEDGSTVTVTATANSGYRFVRWTENGQQVSDSESYSFILTADRSLTAEFARNTVYVPPAQEDGPNTPDSEGWTSIIDELDKLNPDTQEEPLTIEMNGETEVPKEVFETIAGKDVDVVFDMGDGVSWSVNGADIPADADLSNLDLGVSMNTDGIPVEVINAITGEATSVQITLAHDGDFGFALTLSAPLGEENAGYWANLYHYKVNGGEADREDPLGDNEDAGAMDFETAALIDDDGTANLRMTHASQYAIVIDDHPHDTVLPFTDVNADDWFYDPVVWAYGQGLMTGTSATTFEPNTSTTRAMIVAILNRLEGGPTADGGTFTDVHNGDWYAEAVNWAASVGIVAGFEDGTFRPNAPITREQMAAILYNYAQWKGMDVGSRASLEGYSDQPSVWATDVMQWSVAEGLISGTSATTLDPQGSATRAQVSAILQRFLEA